MGATMLANDAETARSLAAAYGTGAASAKQAATYVRQNCSLDDAFGLILQLAQPLYNRARDSAFDAFDQIAEALDALGAQVLAAWEDDAAGEDARGTCIGMTAERVEQEAIQRGSQTQTNSQDVNVSPAGPGGYGGGGGGGGYGGGGGGGYGGGGAGGGAANADADAQAAAREAAEAAARARAEAEAELQRIREENERLRRELLERDGDDAEEPDDVDPTDPDGDDDGQGGGDGHGTITVTVTDEDGHEHVVHLDPDEPGTVNVNDGDSDITITHTGDGDTDITLSDPDTQRLKEDVERDALDDYWNDKSAQDPLGRTPAELQDAWNKRDQYDFSALAAHNMMAYADETSAFTELSAVLNNALKIGA